MRSKITKMLRRSLRQLSRNKPLSSPFGNLPGELVLCIADFLATAADISSLSRVNKALHNLLFDYLLTFNIKYGYSQALIYAAKCNQMSLALNLLRLGADVKTRKNSWTPLSLAAINGNFRIVEMLLEAGARVEGQDPCQDQTGFFDKLCVTPLTCAITKHFDDMALLMLSHIKDVNVELCCHHESPLHLAARHGKVKVVRRLLEMGANPNPAQNKKEIRPLQSVLIEKSLPNHDVVQIVLLLLKFGADAEVSIYQRVRPFDGAPSARYLGQHHRDPRIRAIFSKVQLPLMSMGTSETSGPWLSLITNEEGTGLSVSDDDEEDFDLNEFKIDGERHLLVLDKPFPQTKRLEELHVRETR